MKTRRPISTISYNTDGFLEHILNLYIRERKISFWTYINHVPDKEVGKNHKHIYIQPDKPIETQDLSYALEEPCLDNPIPLKCMPWRFSKFDDWYLYSCHDKYYCMFKGLERNTFYSLEDFISNDDDYLNILVHSIDTSAYSGYNDLIAAFYEGETFGKLINQGKIPLNRVVQYATVWRELSKDWWNDADTKK